jgi:ATP-dependent Clp protease ATP-binding subunit ClpC
MGEIYPEDEQQSFNPNRKHQQGKRPSLVVLDTYGTNISKLAVEGKLDPVVGREEEILRVVQILGRRRKNNPVLVG